MLGCEGHPENTLLLPLFKDHWSQRGPFLQHFVFSFISVPRKDYPWQITGREAVLRSLAQPLIADPNQLPRYQRQEPFAALWAWVSSWAPSAHSHETPSSPSPLSAAKLIKLASFLQSFYVFLISAENHSPDSCHLCIINEQRYHLFVCQLSAPSRKRLLLQRYLGGCGLPCHVGWVMKGYRQQPETWHWRRVIISDIKRACKLLVFYYLCYDNCIWILPFSLIPYLTS